MTKCLRLCIAAATIAASMSSFAADAADVPLRQAQAHTIVAAVRGVPVRDAGFTGWSSSFVSGRDLPRTDTSAECDQPPREWSELLQRRVGIELQQAFKDELTHANYAPTGGNSPPELEVSAFLNDFDMQVCHVGLGTWQGGFYVQVTWKVQEARSGRVLYQASTEGSYMSTAVQSMPAAVGLREAMSLAARNLLAERRFVAVLQPQAVSDQLLARE